MRFRTAQCRFASLLPSHCLHAKIFNSTFLNRLIGRLKEHMCTCWAYSDNSMGQWVASSAMFPHILYSLLSFPWIPLLWIYLCARLSLPLDRQLFESKKLMTLPTTQNTAHYLLKNEHMMHFLWMHASVLINVSVQCYTFALENINYMKSYIAYVIQNRTN